MIYKEFLKALHEQEWFQKFVKEELIPNTPELDSWNPTTDNTDQWKHASGMREGYWMCLKMLGVRDE